MNYRLNRQIKLAKPFASPPPPPRGERVFEKKDELLSQMEEMLVFVLTNFEFQLMS